MSLNGTIDTKNDFTNGNIAQQLFSFDIIQEIERNLGRIPASTTAGKVQWCRDNLASFTYNWYGYGLGPNGYKATFTIWSSYLGGVWEPNSPKSSHTNSSVSKLTFTMGPDYIKPYAIDNNGFMNFIAYADPSDGITASSINTDYVELVITLNASAQLDTRPILSRVANFEGKVSGSTVEVPHLMKANVVNSSLISPGSFTSETSAYSTMAKLDGTLGVSTSSTSGNYPQHLFSFDIVQEVERHLGRIPKATLADKVQWCKDNLKTLITNWYGYGSSVGGNKATLGVWVNNSWVTSKTSTSSSVANLVDTSNTIIPNMIDSNGFAHFLAYADPAGNVADPTQAPTLSASGSGSSLAAGTYYVQYTWVTANGETMTSPEGNITITSGQDIVVTIPSLPFGATQANVYIGTTSGGEYRQSNTTVTTYTQHTSLLTNTATSASRTTNTAVVPSTINTDYVELQIDLKPEAVLHDPLVQLYEVDSTEYSNILVTWDETSVLNRYPKVQGVQHLQNPYVIAEGENLIPPFTDPAWTILTGSSISNPYSMDFNANGIINTVKINTVRNTNYTLTATNAGARARIQDMGGVDIVPYVTGSNISSTFNSGNNDYVTLILGSSSTATLPVNMTNVMLTLGSTAKPFTPRNPSYLFATAKLGQIGTVKDVLYKNDGQWYVRKSVEKDVVLDGSLGWNYVNDYTGFKRVTLTNTQANGKDSSCYITKYNSGLLKDYGGSFTMVDQYYFISNVISITISDTDTGFGETYAPTQAEIQAFFNGWQAKTVDANGKPTAWKSLGDGTDAPTQTLAYVSTNKAPNFTPYKLSYVLATPVVQTAQVEGDIALNGPTQVQVGSGVIVREKVVPVLNNNAYRINFGTPVAPLKNKPAKIIRMYKNGVIDNNWIFDTIVDSGAGVVTASTAPSNFDSTAEYTVSYLLFNIDNTLVKFTNNGLEFKVIYDTSIKSVLDTLAERTADLTTLGSVNVQAIAELYKRVKSLGG
jgi:hypothetical protein